MQLHNNMSVLPFVAFGLASLQQVFIYCVLGQALQSKIENLNAKAYKCSWLEGKGGMQGAAFMICLVGNERSGCKLPGTPFFPMSLQFFVSMRKTVNSSFGYKLLSVLMVFCGQHLSIPPMDRKFGMCSRVLFNLHALIIGLVTVYCVVSSYLGFSAYLHKNFGFAVYIAAGFLGCFECLFRIVYTSIRKKKIEFVAARVHIALYHHNLGTDPQPFVTKMSRIISGLIFFLFGLFFCTTVFMYFENYWRLADLMEHAATNKTQIELMVSERGEFSIELLEAWMFVVQTMPFLPSPMQIKIVSALIFFFCYFAIGRVMLSDMLFYSWYSIIVHQYRQLRDTLGKVLHEDAEKEKLEDWVKYHHTLNELLKEVNSLTAPVIIAAVVFTGIQVSIFSFSIIKLSDQMNVISYTIFGIMSMKQLVIYCILGQKIKDVVRDVKAEAYKCPWVDNVEMKKHAALMVTAASNKDECNLPGAPFFSLSLEFLASMTSGVFTYFMVLIQLNKN
ncbi:Hypothetical predicted protein [Cloeon dipterum]|uniref:Gustatory receptor n=1 Tax=Cloeon dipterum TaxID=197152 RepID=A0A8S1E602_9INSE|nr:Hypothetical predicted protein [Cloeon dipterum]